MFFQKDNTRCRAIAFYLPQFHVIPENDQWWGPGHTEWRHVSQARSLYRYHCQPKIPGALGYYDLTSTDVREAQADLARNSGIEGFCYWHYWFGGKRLLQRPFDEVLESGRPDFPFCLGWANHSWDSRRTFGKDGQTFIRQEYPGMGDHKKHFYHLLEAFSDDRYIKVNGHPLLFILRPKDIPDVRRVTDLWRELACKEGLADLHLVTQNIPQSELDRCGFDATMISGLHKVRTETSFLNRCLTNIEHLNFKGPEIYEYRDAMRHFLSAACGSDNEYPCVIPNWDNTPRAGKNGFVLHGSTPELFKEHFLVALLEVLGKSVDRRIIFIKSWNEWAEGNYLEPDTRHGTGYLDVIRSINT